MNVHTLLLLYCTRALPIVRPLFQVLRDVSYLGVLKFIPTYIAWADEGKIQKRPSFCIVMLLATIHQNCIDKGADEIYVIKNIKLLFRGLVNVSTKSYAQEAQQHKIICL